MIVKLKDLGEIITGNTPSKSKEEYYESKDIGFVKPDVLPGSYIEKRINPKEYISEKARKKARIAKEDSILVSCIGNIGKIGIVKNEVAFNQQINAIMPNNRMIDTCYLAYCLYYNRNKLEAIANAPVVPIINKTQFQEFQIEIDNNIDIQKNIVEILDKISNIIDSKKKQLILLDELIKARFVEMFGGLKPTTTIARYITELRGGKSLAGTEECKNKVLKTGAATFGWFDSEQYKYLPTNYEPLKEHKVETGDVIISRMNTPELVGACSYVFEAPEDMYYPDRLWKVIPKDKTNSIFLWQLLWDREIRRQIKEKSGGTSGTMHNISKPRLLEIKCIDVPIETQDQFAEFVTQVNKSKVAIQKSLDETQLLFDSLMQKYFGSTMNN